jgi:NAD-dependent deacetylase
VIELHGTVRRTRCSDDTCDLVPFEDSEPHEEVLPECPECRSPLRLDIVLFDESLPQGAIDVTLTALSSCDLFLAVGTSGTVAPACNFVRRAHHAGARTILVNLEPTEPPNPYFGEVYLGPAEEVLPSLLG